MPKIDKQLLTDKAIALATKAMYQPDNTGTKCNFFVRDLAQEAFGYSGFAGLLANDIHALIASGRGGWETLYSKPAAGPVDNANLQSAFAAAQDAGNQGYLVAVAMKVGAAGTSGGHCAVVVPGALTPSGQWTAAQLASNLPIIAQAGTSVFASKAMSYGFKPADFKANAFALGVNKE